MPPRAGTQRGGGPRGGGPQDGGRGGRGGRGGGGGGGRGGGGGGDGAPAAGGGGGGGGGSGFRGGRGGRGGPPPQGAARGRGGAGRGGTAVGLPGPAVLPYNVSTVGVKRPGFGTAGFPYAVQTNHYVANIPETTIRHYDVLISATLSVGTNLLLIKKVQCDYPEIFTPKGVYDGRKNLFTTHELALGETNSREFDVTLAPNGDKKRSPKVYKVKITKVAQINPELLQRFVLGQYAHDNAVLTAIMALNVVLRMDLISKYPFTPRSFFTDRETRDIGNGIVLWRGYFQSIRPGIGRMMVNVDISTGMMYKPGTLISLALEFLGRPRDSPNILSPASGFPDRERLRLQRFLTGVRIKTTYQEHQPPRVVRKLSVGGANTMSFTMNGGQTYTVAQYFQTQGRVLQYPAVLCVELPSGALIPFELCTVPPAQIMKKQLPADKTKDMVSFSMKRPSERFRSIEAGIEVLQYGQSEYIRDFGLHVETNSGLLPIQARVLPPPKLKYGPGSKQPEITPRDGAWNMIDKKFFKPGVVNRWIVVVFQPERQFPRQVAEGMVRGFVQGCMTVGMTIGDQQPPIVYKNGQANITAELRSAGQAVVQRYKAGPELMVVILPDGGNDIYTAVKHFGDVVQGVATQCLKSNKCYNAKPQYWANVCLKVNVKLGGINSIPDPRSASVLFDPNNPTVVMGADVMHPAPGSVGRPSFTALVGSVDSNTAKYIARTSVQVSRREKIDDLEDMCTKILTSNRDYRAAVEKSKNPPTRLIFYRDGVSEGQFQQVLDDELPQIKRACDGLGIKPKITLVVVGKRHHVRFLPGPRQRVDRSENCPAGLVVDREICHPTEFDFYLQSHAGIIGTSRPAHYSVLYDENNFNADAMQALSFALCHVYARATRSVSIPAPVYYADIVCARAKNHYDPAGSLALSDTGTEASSGTAALEAFKREYKEIHPAQAKLMYFS